MSLHDIWRGDVMPLSGVAVAIGRNSFDPPAPVVPVFDIHARSLVLHDGSGSGILTFDGTRNHLLLNPSMSGATPVCTAVYIDTYLTGVVGVGNLPNGTVVPLNTIQSQSPTAHFVLSSSVITVFASGTYEISMRLSVDTESPTTRQNIRAWLERSSAAGSFAEVPGSRCWGYCRIDANGEDTSMCTLILRNVAPGDQFRMKAAQEATGMLVLFGPQVNTLSCGLTIEKLE